MRTRHVVPAFLMFLAALVLSLAGYARATTYSGQPLSGTATVTSLSVVAGTPSLFLAGNTGVNTAIQGGLFWSDTTCVLIFQDGSGGPTIGVLGITASVPLPVTPAHLGVGSPGQPGSGICTATKGNAIYVSIGAANAYATSPHVSWTGPVNQQ